MLSPCRLVPRMQRAPQRRSLLLLSTSTVASVRERYDALIATQQLQNHAAQRAAIEAFDALYRQFEAHVGTHLPQYRVDVRAWQQQKDELLRKEIEQIEAEDAAQAAQRSVWQRVHDSVKRTPEPAQRALSVRATALRRIKSKLPPEPLRPATPRGLFLHGSVGTGKTKAMDLFFGAAAPLAARHGTAIQRLHFNDFSQTIYESLHRYRQLGRDAQRDVFDDTIDAAVAPLLGAARADDGTALLCLDEIQVVDVVDAVFLSRMFGRLFRGGNVVLVATANVDIAGLYKSGIRREDFQPFIDALTQRCERMAIDGADFRALAHSRRGPSAPNSFVVRDDAAAIAAAQQFLGHAGAPVHAPVAIPVSWGRHIDVHRWLGERGAVFSFRELCDAPLAVSDYTVLAKRFACIVLLDVPAFSFASKNMARRFISLVDECHNHQCLLFISAAKPLGELFGESEASAGADETSLREQLQSERDTGASLRVRSSEVDRLRSSMFSGKAEEFAFARAVSRVLEMSTEAFAAAAQQRTRSA
jgi:predicted ATPase